MRKKNKLLDIIKKNQQPVLVVVAEDLADGKTLFSLLAMGYEKDWQTDFVLLQAAKLINDRQGEILQARIPQPEAEATDE